MSSEALISVIVPVYKVERFLDRCVSSIVDQSYRNLDIILVDDGSPDGSPAMCDAWAEKDARIRVLHKANGGLSDARNAGMAIAVGEYLSFIDSDDWIAPEMLERLSAALERDDSDIAACAVEMVWEDGSPSRLLTVREERILEREDAEKALLEEKLLKQPVWYKLYRRKIVADLPFPAGKYHEDVFWSYQAVGRARRVSLVDYVGYFYFQRRGSIMGEGYSLKRLDAVEGLAQCAADMREIVPQLEDQARIKLAFACIYHGQLALRYLAPEERKRAFAVLCKVHRSNPISALPGDAVKLTHRFWLMLSRLSLLLCCRARNLLHVGLD